MGYFAAPLSSVPREIPSWRFMSSYLEFTGIYLLMTLFLSPCVEKFPSGYLRVPTWNSPGFLPSNHLFIQSLHREIPSWRFKGSFQSRCKGQGFVFPCNDLLCAWKTTAGIWGMPKVLHSQSFQRLQPGWPSLARPGTLSWALVPPPVTLPWAGLGLKTILRKQGRAARPA